MDYNQLTKVYLKIRDKRAEEKRKFEDVDKGLKVQQEMIEAEMLRFLNDNKVDSSKTDAGTFYRTEDIQPSGSDWDAFYTWVAKEGAFDALERRIKKTFVKEYMEQHEGAVPPGISVYRQYAIRVRRPT